MQLPLLLLERKPLHLRLQHRQLRPLLLLQLCNLPLQLLDALLLPSKALCILVLLGLSSVLLGCELLCQLQCQMAGAVLLKTELEQSQPYRTLIQGRDIANMTHRHGRMQGGVSRQQANKQRTKLQKAQLANRLVAAAHAIPTRVSDMTGIGWLLPPTYAPCLHDSNCSATL